jgi:hypothetical protein
MKNKKIRQIIDKIRFKMITIRESINDFKGEFSNDRRG